VIIIFDPKNPIRSRLFALIGFLITSMMILLGGVWPSIYSLVALPFLPSPFIFIFTVFKPKFMNGRLVTLIYLVLSVIASVICWISEIIWLNKDSSFKIDWGWFSNIFK